jgi:exosortase
MHPLNRSFDALRSSKLSRATIVLTLLVATGIFWVFWSALGTMAVRWSHDPRYSHGFLVPVFAMVLLWLRRTMLVPSSPSWWGVALIAVGALLKLAGAYVFLEWFEDAALIPMLAGLLVLIGGWPWLRWSWPALVFLIFMVPLPYRVERALGGPLQMLATLSSTFFLQTIGLPAVSEGNIIHIDQASIGVVEACNGLGMLVMFAAFATATVFVVRRPLADKVVILLSAVPIAVAANVLRITITGLLEVTVGGGVADVFYHDMAGWLMMPLALGMLWLELFLLSHMLIETRPTRAVPVLDVRRVVRR